MVFPRTNHNPGIRRGLIQRFGANYRDLSLRRNPPQIPLIQVEELQQFAQKAWYENRETTCSWGALRCDEAFLQSPLSHAEYGHKTIGIYHNGSWFMVHRRPLTTHWACKGQVGCAIPLVAPAGRCNAQMNRNKNKYKSNRKLKWNRPPATAAATLLGFPTSVPNIQGKWIG